MVARFVRDEEAAGSNPVFPTTSKQSSLCFDFFIQKVIRPLPCFSSFTKSHAQFVCSVAGAFSGDSLSLPTFCELILTRYEYSHHVEASCISLALIFYTKIRARSFRCFSFSPNGTLGLSVRLQVPSQATRCRYHLFTRVPSAQLAAFLGIKPFLTSVIKRFPRFLICLKSSNF